MAAQRTAILQRFKSLINQQCDCFRNYLAVLEKQKISIESGNTEQLVSYVELEEQIITRIFSIQKVIEPLEAMLPAGDMDVITLKATLEELKTKTVIQSANNRELLSTRMGELRAEIKVLRDNPFANAARSRYHSTASLIDIKG